MAKHVDTLQQFINTAVNFIVNYSFQVIGAIIILVLGVLAANWTNRTLLRFFERKKLDRTLAKFVAGMVRLMVLGFSVLIALGNFGVTIAPFIAAVSALAFGASFAIQGPLSNYGAGLSIILSRPFVVGDTVTVKEVSGVVEDVKLACTILRDEDGVRITIPNKDIVGQIVRNSREVRIVENVVGIRYEDDPEKAIDVVKKVLQGFETIAKNPPAQIGLQDFGDSSLDIGYRYWIPTANYFQTLYAVNLAIYKALSQAGIEMPYPQREIRFLNQPAEKS